jgi:hypothetical protein
MTHAPAASDRASSQTSNGTTRLFAQMALPALCNTRGGTGRCAHAGNRIHHAGRPRISLVARVPSGRLRSRSWSHCCRTWRTPRQPPAKHGAGGTLAKRTRRRPSRPRDELSSGNMIPDPAVVTMTVKSSTYLCNWRFSRSSPSSSPYQNPVLKSCRSYPGLWGCVGKP